MTPKTMVHNDKELKATQQRRFSQDAEWFIKMMDV